jgi:hypothetical protein
MLCLAMWIWYDNAIAVIITSCVYAIALICLCGRTEFTARRAQEKISSQSGQQQYVDEDEYWLLGIIYCNKNDRHITVNSRIGTNMTFNMARPAGMAITALLLLLLAAMPFLGVWTIVEEFTPLQLSISETVINAWHVTDFAGISIADIGSVELINKLPECKRISGSGFSALYKGKFEVENYGVCRICLDPRSEAFIVIRAKDQTYIFSNLQSQDTQMVYELILSYMD